MSECYITRTNVIEKSSISVYSAGILLNYVLFEVLKTVISKCVHACSRITVEVLIIIKEKEVETQLVNMNQSVFISNHPNHLPDIVLSILVEVMLQRFHIVVRQRDQL